MRIALDYDGTYTADPELWDGFIRQAKARGHKVICVTMRRPDESVPLPLEMVYTSRAAKVPYCAAHAIRVDFWIDDSPGWLFADG